MAANNQRIYERKDVKVIIQFNFHGHEKIFESHTRNISLAGIFIEAENDVLELMDKGSSIIVMLEYQKNLFVRFTGYIVRIEHLAEGTGFAMKFLELDQVQEKIIVDLLEEKDQ